MLRGHFSFLNAEQNLGWPPKWNYDNLPRLWQYNLHYFDFLWNLEYEQVKRVVQSWIVNHPIGRAQVGWEPYPISVRLVNWCGVFFGKYRPLTEVDQTFLPKLWSSIFLQTQWLTKNLEKHLLGNHYLENAAALAFVGTCFEGEYAANWLNMGIDILSEQIPEQILSDGLHFELSPMYHCRIMYVFALLLATGNERLTDLLTDSLEKMCTALKHMCHPDGDIALLNDSAFGVYNRPQQLLEYCGRLFGRDISHVGYGDFALPASGYYGWRGEDGDYIVCDAGKIGPDYIPGHAHADIFSFELSLRGHRVIVDAGVHDYEISELRQYCRGTAAHNTVEINGADQCEMWSAFRIARRGYPKVIKYRYYEDGFELLGRHDGYKRLKGRPEHSRRVIWEREGRLTVADEVTSACEVVVRSRVHLHPSCCIEDVRERSIEITYPGGAFIIDYPDQTKVSFEKSLYLAQFGSRVENDCIVFFGLGNDCRLDYSVRHCRD